MPSYLVVALDTTGPVATFGIPSSTVAGTTLTQTITTNEPTVPPRFGRIVDSQGNAYSGVVNAGDLSIALPLDSVNGNAIIEVFLLDELDNQATSTYDVVISGGVAILDPLAAQIAGNRGLNFTRSAGPALQTKPKLERLRDDQDVFLAMGEMDLWLIATDEIERLERGELTYA